MIYDTGDMIQNTSYSIYMYMIKEPFFPLITTKHSDKQNFSIINVYDRSQRKSVLN